MRKRLISCLVLACMVLFSGMAYGDVSGVNGTFTETDQYNNLRLGNDYVVAVVNQDENGQGRFAIETTGGDPVRTEDDNKPLVYGRPKPWTSYTTLWLNGDYYVFGGKTGRRAGKSGKYGQVVKQPYIEDGSIHTITRINDQISIDQILTIVKSSTTGLFDTVQIKYRVENISQEPQKVGIRLMLDTMLGKNDGAPFKIGVESVTTDRLYYKKQLPTFWQAFDSISSPKVISQGGFTGDDVTPPDQVKLADWGSLADGVWDFDFNPGEEFMRKGEYETDSAIAMYWVPELLDPGETRTYITTYGLGGITIVPGLLSLGVTSPAEVTFDTPDKTFPIIAYVENTSEIQAKQVKISLELPDSLKTDEEQQRSLGNLEPGGMAQVVWQVKAAADKLPPSEQYTVRVEAENTDSNQAQRQIKFVGPPELKMDLKLVDDINQQQGKIVPNPFKVRALVSNQGGSTLYDVSTELILPPGLALAPKEKSRKYPGAIQPGETVPVDWQIKALNVSGRLPFAVDAGGLHGHHQTVRFDNLLLPELGPLLYLSLLKQDQLSTGDYITVDIRAENIFGQYGDKINNLQFELQYDPHYLKFIDASPGNLFVKGDKLLPWSRPELVDDGLIRVTEDLPVERSGGTLATLSFRVLQLGEHEIDWQNASFNRHDSLQVDVQLLPLKFK